MNEYVKKLERENQELFDHKEHLEKALKDREAACDNYPLRIEAAFKEGFNVGKKFANANDAWLQSYARARGRE